VIPVGVIVPPDLPAGEFIAYARDAERHGFDQLWVVEDCFFRGGIAQAAVALAQTSTITVGLGILPAGARNPAFAALDIATLENLFPGRLIVGVGHGMPGWIATLKMLLKGDKVTYTGSYVNLSEVVLESPPLTAPPVLAGVRGRSQLGALTEQGLGPRKIARITGCSERVMSRALAESGFRPPGDIDPAY
jgi:5,10-methylenetetrahydromethanopterin reductase